MYGTGKLEICSSYVKCSPDASTNLTEPPLQEHRGRGYRSIGFLDNYWLVIRASIFELDGSLGLLLLDTERVSPMAPTQARFHGPSPSRYWSCVFEEGGYRPSPQDMLTAPFYPDTSQRILGLKMEFEGVLYVTKVETLLRFARERAGEEVQWEEWEPCLVEVPIPEGMPGMTLRSVVSGFRLFFVFTPRNDPRLNLCVYDFSPRSRMKFLHPGGRGFKVMRPSVTGFRLPWNTLDVYDISFGHDSMVAQLVSRFPPPWQPMAQ